MMENVLITQPDRFAAFLQKLAEAPRIAFDTEFIPEHTYYPQLCLIQVATDDVVGVLDPLALGDVSGFWRVLLRPNVEVVVHAGKEELNFCQLGAGSVPARVFDVQLAAGMVGMGFPLSHENLARRVLGQSTNNAETRTDWRKRPLSPEQIEYAVDDVRHLLELRDQLDRELTSRQRLEWFHEEIAGLLGRNPSDKERWRRFKGASGLSRRALAILRELVEWRDRRAKKLDKPPRWVLRDDLLLEMVKRKPRSLRDMQSSRGLGQIVQAHWAEEVVDAVRAGLELRDDQCPTVNRRRESPEEQMVLKILSAAMIHLANRHEIAATLLGSNDDLRDLLEWHAEGMASGEVPRLARGWRANVCGSYLTDLLDGNIVLRVRNHAQTPQLDFESSPRRRP